MPIRLEHTGCPGLASDQHWPSIWPRRSQEGSLCWLALLETPGQWGGSWFHQDQPDLSLSARFWDSGYDFRVVKSPPESFQTLGSTRRKLVLRARCLWKRIWSRWPGHSRRKLKVIFGSLRPLVPWIPSKELSLPTDLIQCLCSLNFPKQKSKTICVYFTVFTIKYKQYASDRMIAFY